MRGFFNDCSAGAHRLGEVLGVSQPTLHLPREMTPYLVGAVATVLLAVYAPGLMLWTAAAAAIGAVIWAACHPRETDEFFNRVANSLNDLEQQWGM